MRCLYLMYWGATEPIGQSGPIPTIVELVEVEGEKVFLVSFDKPADKHDPVMLDGVRRKLADHGVPWTDLGYTKDPPNLSTAWDIAKGVAAATWLVARHRIPVIHGRTYVGAVIGGIVRTIVPGVRFVCHEDGFWPDERVDDGFWREGSRVHRLGRAIERFFHHRADAIIVLSERARDVLKRDPALAGTPIHVIHTSVDERRFAVRSPRRPDEPLRIIHLGSIGGRYMTTEIFRFLGVAKRRDPRTAVTVATRASEDIVERALREADVPRTDLEIVSLAPAEVPAVLGRQHAGVFMLRTGLSNVATSATKVGEYLASGLAVVLTPECGDLHDIVERTNTGIVIRDHSVSAYERAVDQLAELTADPALPARCRDVAVKTMGVRAAAAAQARIHREALSQASRRSARATR